MERYFPAVATEAVFCIGCASYGHLIEACPLRTCRFCGSSADEHMLFGCQTVPAVRESSEPGEAAKSESTASKCPFCLEDNIHVGACPLLWRTFVPSPTSKRSAAEISTACYFCGLDDHFGGDCKDNTGEHISGRRYALQDDVWNRKYALQFSDLTKIKSFTGPSILDTGAASTTVLVVRGSKRQKKTHAGSGDGRNGTQMGRSGNNNGSNPMAGPSNDANTKPKGKGKKGKGKVSQSGPSTEAKNAGDKNLKTTQDNSNPSKQTKAKGKQTAAEPQVSLPTLPMSAVPTPTPVTDPAARTAPNPVSPSTGALDASAAASSNPKAMPYWVIRKGKAAQGQGQEQGQSQAPAKASTKAERRVRAAELQAQREAKAALKAERRAQHEIQEAAAKKRKAEAAKKNNADETSKKRRRRPQDVEAQREKYPSRRRRGRNGDGPGETQGGGEGSAAASA